MKKILSFSILIAMLGLGFVACNDDDKEVVGLEIIKSDVEFKAVGGQGTIEVTSPGAVGATSNKDWLTIDSKTQSLVSFTVDSNDDMLNRTATITITYGGETQTVSVTQAGTIFSTDDLDNLTLTSRAGIFKYDIYSNASLIITSSENWITGSVLDGVLTLDVEVNTATTSRTAVLTVIGSWKEETINVIQEGMALEPDVTKIYANKAGKEYEVTFSPNLGDYFDASTVSDWMTPIVDGEILRVDVEDNDTGSSRTGTIELEMYGQTATITVVQPSVRFNADLIDTDGLYYFSRSEMGGTYLTQFNQVNNQVASDGEVIYNNFFQFMKGQDGLALMVTGFTDLSGLWNSVLIYDWTADEENDYILDLEYLQPNGGSNNADYYMGKFSAYKTLITSTLSGKRYNVIPDDVDNPTSITFTETTNPVNWFTLSSSAVYFP